MNISVELLKDHELLLAYHLAAGYETFEYYPDFKCWRAELKLGEMRLTAVSIIRDIGSSFHNQIYKREMSEQQILKEMRSENIALRWDDNKNFELYYPAFPEITASHPFLPTAFMKVVVKKQLGDFLDATTIGLMNLEKIRTTKGSPI